MAQNTSAPVVLSATYHDMVEFCRDGAGATQKLSVYWNHHLSVTLGRIGSFMPGSPPAVCNRRSSWAFFVVLCCCCLFSNFIGENQFAFSPELDEERIGEVALEYARWMLQVGPSQRNRISTRWHEEFLMPHSEPHDVVHYQYV